MTNNTETIPSECPLALSLLPVAQGDCIHLRFFSEEAWHNIIVDSGPASTAGVFRQLIESIRSRGERIDLLCFSHIDDDHIKGADYVLNDPRFDASIINEIWLNLPKSVAQQHAPSGQVQPATVPASFSLWKSICRHNIPCKTYICQGMSVQIGGMRLQVLLPSPNRLETYWKEWDTQAQQKHLFEPQMAAPRDSSPFNGSSIVLLCTLGAHKILLTGDAYADDLTNAAKTCDFKNPTEKLSVVKLPHHGSNANISLEMLEELHCPNFLISTKETTHRPAQAALDILNEYGKKTSDVTVYANYPWKNLQTTYPHLNIYVLGTNHNIPQPEGILLTCE